MENFVYDRQFSKSIVSRFDIKSINIHNSKTIIKILNCRILTEHADKRVRCVHPPAGNIGIFHFGIKFINLKKSYIINRLKKIQDIKLGE